jgi:hypothetical protein
MTDSRDKTNVLRHTVTYYRCSKTYYSLRIEVQVESEEVARGIGEVDSCRPPREAESPVSGCLSGIAGNNESCKGGMRFALARAGGLTRRGRTPYSLEDCVLPPICERSDLHTQAFTPVANQAEHA